MRAGGGRDGGTRGGVIGIVATVRERWLRPDEAVMFDPLRIALSCEGGRGARGGHACRTPAAECRESVGNIREGRGEAVWETLRGQQYP